MNDIKSGTLAITYIFSDAVVTQNIEIESEMKKELQDLAENWKKRNFIRRYIIADDEIIDKSLIEQNHKQLNGGWIPVSERLPNEEECNKHKTDKLSANHRKFLCTIKISDYGRQTRELYFSEIFGWKYGAEDYNKYVVAWQPLPPAYEED